MRGVDARAAVRADRRAARDAERLEASSELVGVEEGGVGPEVGGGRSAQGARDVPRHGVDRLNLAPVALGGARIE